MQLRKLRLQILMIITAAFLATFAVAQQQSATTTAYCITCTGSQGGQSACFDSTSCSFYCPGGYNIVKSWTVNMTLDRSFVVWGKSVNGSVQSGSPLTCFDGSPPDTIWLETVGDQNANYYISDIGHYDDYTITDATGTHVYDYTVENGQQTYNLPIHGSPGSFSATFNWFPATPGSTDLGGVGVHVPPYLAHISILSQNAGLWVSVVKDNAVDLGAASPRSGCEGTCGAPINLTNGNTWIQHLDYSLSGLGGGLNVTRTWNSMWVANFPFQQAGMFGDSWQSNYEEHIVVSSNPNVAMYWRADGSAWEFSYTTQGGRSSYTLTSPLDQRGTLSYDSHSTTFTMAFMDGSQRIFNSSGYLTTIIDRNGNQTAVTHDASNRITKVTDAAGRVLTFNYANPSYPNQVSSIQDATGTVATYSYVTGRLLSNVVYADGSSLNFQYDSSGLILSVTDGQGKVFESHTYDDVRRGATSSRAAGVDQLSIAYPVHAADSITLTDSQGNATNYLTQTIATRNYVTASWGPGCNSWVAIVLMGSPTMALATGRPGPIQTAISGGIRTTPTAT